MLKIAKNLGSVGLLFTISKSTGVDAIKTAASAQTEASVDA